MTTKVTVIGIARVTNVMTGPGGKGTVENVAQPIEGLTAESEGSFVVHNTLSLRVEGKGATVKVDAFYDTLVEGDGESERRVDAGQVVTFEVGEDPLVISEAAPAADEDDAEDAG